MGQWQKPEFKIESVHISERLNCPLVVEQELQPIHVLLVRISNEL